MKKKVVIIGGGFAGSHAAKDLEKDFDVTLLDTKDYFEFTPGILRTIVEPEHIRKIQVLHTDYLRFARVIRGKVTSVTRKYVNIENRRFDYDYLVIASGSSYEAPFKDPEIVNTARGKRLRNYYSKLLEAKRVLIIGGGVVGVEMAGEIVYKYPEKEVIMVHSKERLIDRNFHKAINYAEKILKKKGVKILFSERVKGKRKGVWVTTKGKKIQADLVFLCTGIKPNYDFIPKKYLGNRGIKVDKYLRIIGFKNAFAIGDVTGIREEKTAQNAERQADSICKNICNLENERDLSEYTSKKIPMLISLGKYKCILSKGDFVMAGLFPALMKSLVEKWEMWKKRSTN